LDLSNDVFGNVSPEDVPDEADSVELLLELNLESDIVFLTVEKRSVGELLLMAARHECKSLLESFLDVALVNFDEVIGNVVKEV